jgi:hypothetical protein
VDDGLADGEVELGLAEVADGGGVGHVRAPNGRERVMGPQVAQRVPWPGWSWRPVTRSTLALQWTQASQEQVGFIAVQ